VATILNMPRLGLTMSEGRLVKWLKAEGDEIKASEEYVEIESDKSVVAHEAPEAGYLLKILAIEGDVVEIYKPIAVIGEQNESIDEVLSSIDIPPAELGEKQQRDEKQEKMSSKEVKEPKGRDRIFISPAARRIATENNINIAEIPFPKGKQRIEKAHVIDFIESSRLKKTTPLASKIAEEHSIDLKSLGVEPGKRIFSKDLQQVLQASGSQPSRIQVAGMRKIIAARMKDSIDTAAHVSLTTEVDMSKVIEMRQRIIDRIMKKWDVKVSINDIVIKCTACALKEHPRINSVFTQEEIIEKSEINIGVAVALQEGLIVPVIRNADMLSVGQIAAVSKELSAKAKASALNPDEYNGGTFTVSNLGMYDITQFTSIINQPESAILSVAKVVERPVVLNGEIVVRPIMNLSINFDHRPIDGAMAAIFLKRVKELLEEPYELMI
jgi:pyruvate dehydrogenase E2 component (dihydrolipoamide acetyltransferase)